MPAKSQPKKSRTEKSPSSQIQLLRSETLDFPWLVHSFSTRAGGVSRGGTLNLGFTKNDSRAAVERNRNLFLKATGAEGLKSVSMRQIHSDIIHHISDIPISPLVGDGVITNTPGLLLSIQTADCLPILLADPKKRAVGAFHAGWRGTLARVVEKGIGEMRRQFGSNPRDLRAAIGPGIHKCCYQVGPRYARYSTPALLIPTNYSMNSGIRCGHEIPVVVYERASARARDQTNPSCTWIWWPQTRDNF